MFSGKHPEDLPDFIRLLSGYVFEEIGIEKKIAIENLLKENIQILNPETNFQIDQLCGCFCHSIREILFALGCINNMPLVLPSEYNIKHYYRFLVDKKKYLLLLTRRLSSYLV